MTSYFVLATIIITIIKIPQSGAHCQKLSIVGSEWASRSPWETRCWEWSFVKVATLVTDKDQPEKAKTSQQRRRVEDLRGELQEAEAEESIADVSATMHVLNADLSHKSTLGPTLTVFWGSTCGALGGHWVASDNSSLGLLHTLAKSIRKARPLLNGRKRWRHDWNNQQ